MLAMTYRSGLFIFLLAASLVASLAASPPLVAQTPSGAAPSAQNPAYLSGVDDLPLMAGLSEAPDQGVIFDTPDGRIVEAYASGPVGAETVRKFYQVTLPQLGWAQAGPGQFVREGEQLTVEILDPGPTSTSVRFQLKPKP